MSMPKKILSFFALIWLFFVMTIFWNVELQFNDLFLSKLLEIKTIFFILIAISIFIYWKKVIDSLK